MDYNAILLKALNKFGDYESVEQVFFQEELEAIYIAMNNAVQEYEVLRVQGQHSKDSDITNNPYFSVRGKK
jgi:hypothetical protein